MADATADQYTERRADIKITGVPGAWTIRSRDGRRRSEVLDDSTARDYARLLHIDFPGDQT
jgi:hypothetical protein